MSNVPNAHRACALLTLCLARGVLWAGVSVDCEHCDDCQHALVAAPKLRTCAELVMTHGPIAHPFYAHA